MCEFRATPKTNELIKDQVLFDFPDGYIPNEVGYRFGFGVKDSSGTVVRSQFLINESKLYTANNNMLSLIDVSVSFLFGIRQ